MSDFEKLYNERTRMYDEVVEECGESKDKITLLETRIEKLRQTLFIMSEGECAGLSREYSTEALTEDDRLKAEQVK